MKKLLPIVLFTLVTGCTIERQIVEAPTTTVTVDEYVSEPEIDPSDSSTWPIDESGFIEATHSNAPLSMSLDRSELLSTGYATCDAFASGLSLVNIVQAISDASGGDADIEDMLQWISVNAVVYLCPEYASQFDETL